MYFILSIKYSLSNTKQFPFQENNQVDKCNNTLPEVGNNWPPGNHFILTEQKYKCSRNSPALQLSQLTSHQEDAVTVTYGIILVSRRTRSFLKNSLPRLDGRIVDVGGELLEVDGRPPRGQRVLLVLLGDAGDVRILQVVGVGVLQDSRKIWSRSVIVNCQQKNLKTPTIKCAKEKE